MIRTVRNYLAGLGRACEAQAHFSAPREELPGGQSEWIENSLGWFIDEFGRGVLMKPVVRPVEFIPTNYAGTESEARSLFDEVRTMMDLSAVQIELRFDLADTALPAARATSGETSHRAQEYLMGQWMRTDQGTVISVASRLVSDPVRLIATFAHELGHELLVGSGRIRSSHPAQESLTDLLTVFYGLGIFTANASFEQVPSADGKRQRSIAHGYLREGTISEALAHYALLRGERGLPPWAKELDPIVKWLTIGWLGRLRCRTPPTR